MVIIEISEIINQVGVQTDIRSQGPQSRAHGPRATTAGSCLVKSCPFVEPAPPAGLVRILRSIGYQKEE